MLIKNLKLMGFNVNKNYEKKRKILEKDVSEAAMKNLKIKELLEKVEQYEKILSKEKTA